MFADKEAARARAAALYEQGAREKALAMQFPNGALRDTHWMRSERLSDEAWSIEEAHDLDPGKSGLWRD